jgi:nucleoside-diphosphate-sugar epimerase
MAHYRDAKAFMHISTMGVYHPHDSLTGYRETDPVGPGPAGIQYTSSKLMAEGVVRSLCRIFSLPAVICRITCQYGESGPGGIPKSLVLDPLIRGEPIVVAADGEKLRSPIHNDDIVSFLEPLLAAAAIPAGIVNCGGDHAVSVEMMARYMGDLLGMPPRFEIRHPYPWPCGHLDPSKRLAITGPCKVYWKDGIRRLIEYYYPDIELRSADS